MDPGNAEWWRRHGWTIGLLLLAFGLAFGLRTIWQYPIIQQYGALYTYAGGSDSYYHSRVMTYIIQDHRNLIFDPMLKFPIGAINPREPLFDWMNAILGIVFAPFFGGNAVNAGAWFLDLQSPLWAAFAVFPIYLIGREVSGRRTGLLAALVYPFFSASIDSSTFGYADYLSFYTFFLLVVLYAYLRTLKAVGHRRWVESYRQPRQLLPALRGFLRQERTAVKWSVFTGVSLGAFALSWQGYTYAIVIIAFTALIAMLIERIRHVDSFSLYVSTWIIGLVAFAMASPYYLVQGEIKLFLELPIILFFGTLLLLLPFLFLRDVPWVFSIPTLVVVIAAGVVAFRFVSPAFFQSAITGNGYFVKTLVYTTVAEAQAPSIDALIVGYGVVTFFLAFAGLALFGYHLVHQRFKRFHIAFLIFAVVSIYLPISATKFFLVASPAFALLAGEGIHRLLDVGGYPQLRRAVASLSDRKGNLSAFRKSFKARHVLVLALAVGILLPNVWISIDAGIPSNTKSQFETQIANTIPSWLKLNTSAPASNYLGAAGVGLDTSNQYDSAGYTWLSEQDANIPEPSRPAVVAWWDYGFQTIDQGGHPSVADNFQNGIDPAGQFLLSQNESLAIGILTVALLQGELKDTGKTTLPAGLNALLAQDGVNVTTLHRYLTDESADYQLVIHNPQIYLPVNPSTITEDNAMYLVTSYYLADHFSLSAVAQIYDNVEGYTGWQIRYGMTDSRTFPFSGSDTGIFYAPADLTGRVISDEGIPTTFFNVTILGSDGNTYPLGQLPAGVTAAQYNINYSAPFYNTMLYRIYIGYNGTDVGQSGGIPGLSGTAQNDPIEPGWMLQHFEVLYQTAYVCPGVRNATAGSTCMVATNRPTAVAIANRTNGTDDLSAFSYFDGGESILAYYSGVTLYGRVVLPDGSPVPGVRATIYDAWGIPHMTSLTNLNGTFSVVLPPGNDTLNLTYGSPNPLTQSDTGLLASIKMPISPALGFDTVPQSMVETFTVLNSTVTGQAFWNVTGNGTYVPGQDPVVRGAAVTLSNTAVNHTLTATTDPSGAFVLSNVPPGTYNVTVRFDGQTYNESQANVSSGTSVRLSLPMDAGSIEGKVLAFGYGYTDATVTLTNASGGRTTTVSSSTGAFNFTGLAPGTYGVSAVGTTPTLVTGEVRATVPIIGATVTVNLTIVSGGSAKVAVQAGGLAVPNATVTFLPFVTFTNESTSALGAIVAASTNTTLATTNVQGVATTVLAAGRYSVIASAHVSGQLQTAAGVLYVTGVGGTPSLVLNLTTAQALTVNVAGAAVGGIRTAVIAFSATGAQILGWAAPNGSALLPLAPGGYSLLAVQGSSSPNATNANLEVGLASVTVTGARAVAVSVGSGEAVRFTVGTPGKNGEVLAAPNATVNLSAGIGGPSVPSIGDAEGRVGFFVPVSQSGASGGYCIGAAAFGFTSKTACGYTARQLATLGTFNLSVVPVPVRLEVQGLPNGTSVTVNITGESVATSDLQLTGGPSFAFPLVPGVYGVGASAVIDHGTTIYLPSSILSTTIPLGATYSNLTLILVPEINVSGTLTVPAGGTDADATISLASPLLNVSVSGTAYTKSFRATPATYTATALANVGGVTYVNVTRVTVTANGTISPRLVISEPGLRGNVTLTQPNGKALPANTTVELVTAEGLVILETAKLGNFAETLPSGTFRVYANATLPNSNSNGTYQVNWTTAPSATCTLSPTSTRCSVPMVGTPVKVTVRGTLVPAGSSAAVAGTLQLRGPYPSTNITTVAAPAGRFSVSLLPGAYGVYAVSSTGTPLAAFGEVLALPGVLGNTTISLVPTWTDTVDVSVLNSSTVARGPANVSVQDLFGDVTTFSNVSFGTPLSLALPRGTYTVSANASGTRGGLPGTAVASAKVVLTSGNVFTGLAIGIPDQPALSAKLVGSTSETVAAGGVATFQYTVRNAGNVPVTVHPIGAPSTWSFAFPNGNATLAPGANVSGQVRITVAGDALVAHGPVSIVFDLPNGTEVGAVSPAPTVNVLPYYGLVAGRSAPPQIGSTRAVLTLYSVNTGNTGETVRYTLLDADRLAADGWSIAWSTGTASGARDTATLRADQNLSVALYLNSTSTSFAIPPGSLTVQATVLNITGSITRSVILPFPRPSVGTAAGSLVVVGPSVSSGPSPTPAWLVPLLAFVPALLLIAGVVTVRWWRTRRWTRW